MCDTNDSLYTGFTPSQVKRPRGRPAGSPNKPKNVHPTQPKKRPPGRPKGSLNKSTANNPKAVAPQPKKRETAHPNKYHVCPFAVITPAEPKKHRRSADKHTRKSAKSTAAATIIQRYARRYINDHSITNSN